MESNPELKHPFNTPPEQGEFGGIGSHLPLEDLSKVKSALRMEDPRAKVDEMFNLNNNLQESGVRSQESGVRSQESDLHISSLDFELNEAPSEEHPYHFIRLPSPTDIKPGSFIILGQSIFEFTTAKPNNTSEILNFDSIIQEAAECDDTKEQFIQDQGGGFGSGLDMAKMLSAMKLRYDATRNVYFPDKPLEFLFYDDLTQSEPYKIGWTMKLLQSRIEAGLGYTIPLPISSYKHMIRFGFRPNETGNWAMRRDNLKYVTAVNELKQSKIMRAMEVDTYKSQKLRTKSLMEKHKLPIPEYIVITEINNLQLQAEELFALSTDEPPSIFLKEAQNNNGYGISKISKTENGYTIQIPINGDTGKLIVKNINISDFTVNTLIEEYKKAGYTEGLGDHYFFEAGKRRMQIGEHNVEFRLTIVDEEAFEYYMKIIPKGEYRANQGVVESHEDDRVVQKNSVGGEIIMNPKQIKDFFISAGMGDQYGIVDKELSSLASNLFSKIGSMVNETSSVSFDVIIDPNNSYQPSILELQVGHITTPENKKALQQKLTSRYQADLNSQLQKLPIQNIGNI